MDERKIYDLKQLRILVIDDEPKITDEMRKRLEEMGCIADAYNDPNLVLTTLKSERYDLIIMDVNLPQVDGYSLYQKISDLNGNARICLMSDSTANDHEFLSLFPIWKARDYFHKPIKGPEIVELVKGSM
ncbi:MAG: response regulator transcription factor [Candidatus Eiseniibacteriota bacterium]